MPVAGTVQAWGMIAAMGLGVAPFSLAAILTVLYYLFALPVPSSFAAGARRTSIGQHSSRPSMCTFIDFDVHAPTRCC